MRAIGSAARTAAVSAAVLVSCLLAACAGTGAEPPPASPSLPPTSGVPPATAVPAATATLPGSIPTTAAPTPPSTPRPTAYPAAYADSLWAIEIGKPSALESVSPIELMAQAFDGGVIASGSYYFSYPEDRNQILKLSQSGEVVWRFSVGTEHGDKVRILSVLPVSDGGALISGQIVAPGDDSPDAPPALLRLSADGRLHWQASVAGDPTFETTSGGFLLVGNEGQVHKLDHAGTLVWSKTIHLITPLGTAVPSFARELSGSDLLIAGYEEDFAPVRPPSPTVGRLPYPVTLWFARIGIDDEVRWIRYYEFRGYSGAVPTHDGGIAVAGDNYIGDTDYGWLLKITPEGDIAFWKRYRELSFVFQLDNTAEGGFLLRGSGPIPILENDFGPADQRMLGVDRVGIAEWAMDFGPRPSLRLGTTLVDGSAIALLPGPTFYRFDPVGRLPDCETISPQMLELRTTDVIPPPDRSDLVEGPSVIKGRASAEDPSTEQSAVRLEALPWEVTELCRTFR